MAKLVIYVYSNVKSKVLKGLHYKIVLVEIGCMFLERKILVVRYGLVRVDWKFPNRSSSLRRARS